MKCLAFRRWETLNPRKSAKLRQIRQKLLPSEWEKIVKKSAGGPTLNWRRESDLNPLLCKYSQEDDCGTIHTPTKGSGNGSLKEQQKKSSNGGSTSSSLEEDDEEEEEEDPCE